MYTFSIVTKITTALVIKSHFFRRVSSIKSKIQSSSKFFSFLCGELWLFWRKFPPIVPIYPNWSRPSNFQFPLIPCFRHFLPVGNFDFDLFLTSSQIPPSAKHLFISNSLSCSQTDLTACLMIRLGLWNQICICWACRFYQVRIPCCGFWLWIGPSCLCRSVFASFTSFLLSSRYSWWFIFFARSFIRCLSGSACMVRIVCWIWIVYS